MVVTLVSDRVWTQHAKPSVQILWNHLLQQTDHPLWKSSTWFGLLGAWGSMVTWYFISFLCDVFREELSWGGSRSGLQKAHCKWWDWCRYFPQMNYTLLKWFYVAQVNLWGSEVIAGLGGSLPARSAINGRTVHQALCDDFKDKLGWSAVGSDLQKVHFKLWDCFRYFFSNNCTL